MKEGGRAAKRQAIAKAIVKKGAPVTSSLLLESGLTPKQAAYVENRSFGMDKQDAATAAGYKDPAAEARDLEKIPNVMEALSAERRLNQRLLGFTREDVLNGIKKAIDDASILADPQAQIAGWREIAKICGHYAPEVKQIQLTAGQQAKRGELEALTDEQLLEIMTGRPAIEGESRRIQ